MVSEGVARALRRSAAWGVHTLISSIDWWGGLSLVLAITVFYSVFVDSHDSLVGWFFFELKNHLIGLLYLVPFAIGTVRRGLRGAVVSWGVCMVAVTPRLLRYSLGNQSLITNVMFLSLPFLVVLMVLLELEWRATHRRLAQEREQERQRHIEQVYRAQEAERIRIAQDLHDDILQRLLAIGYAMESLNVCEHCSSSRIGTQLAEIRRENLRLVEDLRRLSYDLRPSILDNLGLVAAVGWLTGQLSNESGVGIHLEAPEFLQRFSSDIETAAFRVVQESLYNVLRHSGATQAIVRLSFSCRVLVLEVEDNGVGFEVKTTMSRATACGHLGLLGMKWRLKPLGGSLLVRSKPGEGTRVLAKIPIETDGSIPCEP
ncbi:MAG: sensor histidine kinase [Candidatus Thorarchaeota archaeon]